MVKRRKEAKRESSSTDMLADNLNALTKMYMESRSAVAQPNPNDRAKAIVDMVGAQVRLLNSEQQQYYLQEITQAYCRALNYRPDPSYQNL